MELHEEGKKIILHYESLMIVFLHSLLFIFSISTNGNTIFWKFKHRNCRKKILLTLNNEKSYFT